MAEKAARMDGGRVGFYFALGRLIVHSLGDATLVVGNGLVAVHSPTREVYVVIQGAPVAAPATLAFRIPRRVRPAVGEYIARAGLTADGGLLRAGSLRIRPVSRVPGWLYSKPVIHGGAKSAPYIPASSIAFALEDSWLTVYEQSMATETVAWTQVQVKTGGRFEPVMAPGAVAWFPVHNGLRPAGGRIAIAVEERGGKPAVAVYYDTPEGYRVISWTHRVKRVATPAPEGAILFQPRDAREIAGVLAHPCEVEVHGYRLWVAGREYEAAYSDLDGRYRGILHATPFLRHAIKTAHTLQWRSAGDKEVEVNGYRLRGG